MDRLWGVTTFAAVLIATTAAAEPAWRTPGQDEADLGRRLAAAGRCAEALEPFDRAVEARSEDATVRRDRGLCHEQLGDPEPAMEDYRAYLSMAPTAPDAGPIRTRLDALERAQAPAPAGTPGSTNPQSATPLDEKHENGDGDPIRDTGWLLGLHVGARSWNSAGYPKPTASYGFGVGWAYRPHLEADARLVLLTTNVNETSGVGFSIGTAWKMAFDDMKRYQIAIGLGAGYESEQNRAGDARHFVFVRATPTFRWAVLSSVMLDIGPEIGFGSITRASTSVDQVGPDSSVSTAYYAGYLELLWLLGS